MKNKKSVLKKISNIVLTVVLILLTFVVVLTVITRITGNTPSLFGYSILRVSTGSMEPDLMIGDVILSYEVDDVNSLKVGDVITYRGTVGEYSNKLITHEVVKAPYEENGITYVITKGIANQYEDQPVQEGQIVGSLVCKIPFIDLVYSFFLTPWGLLTAIALIILAFAGEFWNIFKLAHQSDELPDVSEVNQETLEKAIEQYKQDKQDNIDDCKGESDPSDTPDNTNK